VFLREKIATNTPDPLVAAVAEANDAILVSLDADFRKLARRYGVAGRRFRNLSLIKLSCRESRAAGRLQDAMTLIYHEWEYIGAHRDRRLFIEIGDNVIRTVR
jgi:predicted nuclease of predicted toxin-antitoxin system